MRIPPFIENIFSAYPVPAKGQNEKWAKMAAAGDNAAREKILLHNLRLAVRYAQKYARSFRLDGEFEDLVSEGLVGLNNAIEAYEKSKKNTSFLTYASGYITNKMRSHVSRMALPVHMNETYFYEMVSGKREPVRGVPLVVHHESSRGGESPQLELAHVDFDHSFEIEDQARHNHALLSAALSSLSASETDVIEARYGLGGGKSETTGDVARRRGFSRQCASALEHRALNKLRKALERTA